MSAAVTRCSTEGMISACKSCYAYHTQHKSLMVNKQNVLIQGKRTVPLVHDIQHVACQQEGD